MNCSRLVSVLGVVIFGAVSSADGSRFPTRPSAAGVRSELSAADGASVGQASSRQGILTITKECSAYDGTDGTYCTVTSSSLAAIDAGSRVVYATADGFGDVDSDVTLDLPGPGNNAAFGHCTLNACVSRCEFSGGTGKFIHFHAIVEVTYLGGLDYGWNGTYSFNLRD
jgi:hypothetical protein